MLNFEEKFWTRVEKTETCWIWRGSIGSGGYGRVTRSRKRLSAHRVAYELIKGPIPEGLVIDHLCRVRSCVNPDHLEAVTHGENIRRGETGKHGNHWTGPRKTHCTQGHEFAGDNLGFRKAGRYCKTCSRESSLRSAAKRRGRREEYSA